MRAISVDLRRRACEAVETEGLSCRAAAARFKVGVSSVIRCARNCGKPVRLRRGSRAGTAGPAGSRRRRHSPHHRTA